MYEQILSRIRTTEDQEKILEEIDLLLSSFYQDKGMGFDSTLRTKVRFWFSSILKEEFSKEKVDKEEFLNTLRQKVLDMEKVYLTLAFEPSIDTLDRISGLIRTFIGKPCLIDFSFDPRLIGGVEIIYKGEYRDFSFRRIFEEEFEKSREEFLKRLKG